MDTTEKQYRSAEEYLNAEYRGKVADTKEGLTNFIIGWNACASNFGIEPTIVKELNEGEISIDSLRQYGYLVACNEVKQTLDNMHPTNKIVELSGGNPHITSMIVATGVDYFDARSLVEAHNEERQRANLSFNDE